MPDNPTPPAKPAAPALPPVLGKMLENLTANNADPDAFEKDQYAKSRRYPPALEKPAE